LHLQIQINLIAMSRKSLLVLILFGIPCLGFTQVFSNLDFEYGAYKAQPRKWSIEGEGEKYFAQLDSVNKSGKSSLHVTLKKAQVFIFMSVPGKVIAGKTIRVEGYIKSGTPDSLQAMFLFRNPNGGKPVASPPINKAQDWQIISHKASFPENYSSDRLLIALMADGTGEFWFDNVVIKIDDDPYGDGDPDFSEPTVKDIEALNEKTIPIRSLESNASLKDLSPLRDIVGSASIVALGENSHGSSPIYKLKLRMIKYLVENEGFSIFALEAPTVEADQINEYVFSGQGNLNDVIKKLIYPSWQTREMADIIEWMKTYNQRARKKIEFRGFDMQNGTAALHAVEGFAKINDATLLADVIELTRLYSDPQNNREKWELIAQHADQISLYLESKNYPNVNARDFATIKHYMTIFSQSLSSNNASAKTKSRDEYMAQNIEWLFKNSGENTKIIVSADNTHITKASGKMGYFLKGSFGDQYLTIGFTYNKGTYSAYGPAQFYEVHPSFAGTYEYYFSKAKFKNYFLDIKRINDIAFLNKSAGFRSIGSRPQETSQFGEINLKDHFDVIAYIENSTHTVPFK
jgi:erythromycin esterase